MNVATRRGTTLIEILTVLAIISTMAAVAIPRYGSASTRYRVDLAAERIADDLRQASALARQSSAPCTIRFDAGLDRYDLDRGTDLKGAGTSYQIDLSAEPYGVEIVAVSFTVVIDPRTMTFDGYGDPVGSGSVTIRRGDTTRVVILNALDCRVTIQ